MQSRFNCFRKDRDWHPDEGDLLLYLDGEQPSRKAARIRLHLEACWACRVGAEKTSQTISSFMDYRNRILLPSLPSAAEHRGGFEGKLHALAVQTPDNRPSWSTMLARVRAWGGNALRAPLAAGVAAVLVLGLAVAASYVWSPTVNAQRLLAQASAMEDAHDNNPNLVLHRSLRMEKRKYGDKQLLLRRRIDLWHSGARGITARRVYDDSGKLVAGEWSERNGSSAVYETGARPEIGTRSRMIPKVLDSPDDLWEYDLSAGSFEGLTGTAAHARVDNQGNDFVVHYEPRDRTENNRLLSAALTVRKDDFRAVALEVTVREPESPGIPAGPGTPVVYSIVESSFEQRPAREVNPQVFQTDAELLASPLPAKQGDAAADLQMETTYLLDQVGATLGQEVTVTVGADGKLHVEGVLATESRRAQIIKALAPVRHNPVAVINLITVAEALQRKRVEPAVATTAGTQAESASIPLFDQLSQYFEANTASDSSLDVRAKIQRLSEQVLEDSGEAMRHAWVLKRLANAIPPAEIGNLSETTHNQYLCMVAAHAQKVGERTGKLRLELAPILFPDGISPGMAEEGSGATPADLTVAVRQLFEAASQNDAAIQYGFSVTTGQAAQGAAKVQEIQHSLLQAEQLSKWLRQAANAGNCSPESQRK